MSNISQDFAIELEGLHARFKNVKADEFRFLLHLALEREEVVSVAYRDSRLRSSLDRLSLSPGAIEIFRTALIWIWKDEEMHTTYVRSVLWNHGKGSGRWRVLASQWGGSLGGWSSAVLQHNDWWSAPISRVIAKGILAAGARSGKVPQAMVEKLNSLSFQDFCELNAEAEVTARMCWARICKLAQDLGVDPEVQTAFQRITDDEERHRQIFTILRDYSLAPGDEQQLTQRIRSVGLYFLPRHLREVAVDDQKSAGSKRNPAAVTTVACQAYARLSQRKSAFMRVLQDADFITAIVNRAAASNLALPEMKIVIKVPFMMAYDHKDQSPIVDLEMLRELCTQIHEITGRAPTLVERGNIYERFHQGRDVKSVAAYLGIDETHYGPVVDMGTDQVAHEYPRGLGLSSISQTWRDADFRISFGKLRSHSSDHLVGAVANLEGVGPRWDDYIFFERSVDFAAAQSTLVTEFPAHFAIMDAGELTPDGMVGVMGHPDAGSVRRYYASTDAVILDQCLFAHLGLLAASSSVLREILYWRGESLSEYRVLGMADPIRGWKGPHSNDFCALLSLFSHPFYEYTGRGRLFVPIFDEKFFPPVRTENLWVRLLRGFVRWTIAVQFFRGRRFS